MKPIDISTCKMHIKSLLLFLIFILPVTVTATPTLVWLKPIESDQKMKGHSIVSGSALELMKFVANKIKNVNHLFEAYPIRRSWHLIQNTKQEQVTYCFWGATYKKEREDWGYFTEPTSVTLPYMVAARKNDLSEFEQNGSVSVEELLKNKYTTVIFEKITNAWTKIIEQLGYRNVVQISGLDKDLSAHTLLLIEKGRIDFGYISHRTIANLDIDYNQNITLYEIRELSKADVGDSRLLCSKSPLGKQMVTSINIVLSKIHSDEKLNLQMRELVFKSEGYPERLRKTFEHQWMILTKEKRKQ